MQTNLYEQFEEIITDQELISFQESIQNGGYPSFRRLLDGFKKKIEFFDDTEAEQMTELIEKAQKWFPQPGKFSPSWERIWDELEQIIIYKIKLLNSIPTEERSGEWQVVMDNPYTNQEVVCYPGLSFIEAAYLYGYFRPELEKNEYMRIQKVQSLIMEFGS